MWQLEVDVFPDLKGASVLELGCGGAQGLLGIAGEGAARLVGLDNSEKQLEHAWRHLDEAGVEAELVHASAESLPFDDASFDLVFCDHGAMSFADPKKTVPEVARVLRPGGALVFSLISDWMQACYDEKTEAVREHFVYGYWERDQIEEDGVINFHVPVGDWIRLFRANGLTVEDLIELRPEPGMTTTYEGWPYEWCRKWPGEHLWKVSKT